MALMDDMPEEKFSEVSNLCELIKENILVWSGKEKKEWLNLTAYKQVILIWSLLDQLIGLPIKFIF